MVFFKHTLVEALSKMPFSICMAVSTIIATIGELSLGEHACPILEFQC